MAAEADVPDEPETDEETTEFKAVKTPEPTVEEANFDLAAELSDVFDEDPNEASGSGEAGDDGFSAVFDAFKKGVSETLTAGDHEAHFDLGIAYKEMGLFDDAIQEFRAAMVHPPRVIECLHLIGLCALDGGQPGLAVEHLEQMLETDGVVREQIIAGRFELGRAYEALGRIGEAKAAYLAVLDLDPNFQDAAARHAALDSPAPAAPESAQDEGFESFEDFMGDDEEAAEDGRARGHRRNLRRPVRRRRGQRRARARTDARTGTRARSGARTRTRAGARAGSGTRTRARSPSPRRPRRHRRPRPARRRRRSPSSRGRPVEYLHHFPAQ